MGRPETIAREPRHGAAQTMLAAAMLTASLGTSIANVALPALSTAFGAPFARVQWVVAAYLVALTLSAVAAGRLGDRVGRRRTLIAGLLLYAAASALGAAAGGLWQLIAARAVQGAGGAVLMVLSVAMVRDTARAGEVGRAMGLLGTMSAVGTALGPVLGGALLELGGWRAVFALPSAAAIAVLAVAIRALPADPGGGAAAPSGSGLWHAAALAPALLANAAVAAVMMATLIAGPFYLGLGLGLREAAVGAAMSVGPVISMLTGVPAGRSVDRLGPRPAGTAGLAALIGGALGLALLPGALGLAGYLAAIAVLTPGYQLFQAANNTAVLARADAAGRGAAAGLLTLSRNLGLVIGASGLGALFALGAGPGPVTQAPPAALSDGLRLTFLFAAALLAGALWLFRTRG